MCGVNGVNTRDLSLVESMNRAIRHRGPDYAGTFVDDSASLGHVLLSIRGVPDASRQPFHDPGSDWVLLFNGQLYNTAQLKARLGPEMAEEELDTRLLYETIKRDGWGFAPKVHGMFAIALYNTRLREIRLYRDPSGQKPLYYYLKDGRFAFSSEIKGILACPFVDRETDREAAEVALCLGYIPGDRTLFRHIRKVDLSQEVIFRLDDRSVEARSFRSELDGYYPAGDEEAFQLLIDEHLQSKRKVSLNLSGGLDSSLILHEMSRKGAKVDTYTTAFEVEGGNYNHDAQLARRLSKDYGTNHHELMIRKADFLDAFGEAYRAVEEPNYNNSIPHLYLLFKHEGIRGDGNRVVLSGDGGDEIFAGYPHHQMCRRVDRIHRFVPAFLHNRLISRRTGEDFDLRNVPERWYYFRRMGRPWTRLPVQANVRGYVRRFAEEYIRLYGVKDCNMQKTMLVDRSIWLAGENFLRSDKLGMANSMELRSPLSYMPFREAMDRRIPESMYHGKQANKLFLRNHYRDKLPMYIVDRTEKTGWRSPIQVWYDASYRDRFLDILDQADGPDSLVDWKAVSRRVREHSQWPGRKINLYLSLALLKKEFKLDL